MSDLKDMMAEGTLGRVVRSFKEATDLVAIIIDASGNPIWAPKDWDNCAVCRLVRSSPEGRMRCQGSYADAGRYSARLEDLYVFQCHAGLVNWAAPLTVDSAHIGSVVCGQVIMWQPTALFIREIVQRTEGLGIKRSDLEKAVAELKQVSTAKVQASAELLFSVSSYVVQSNALASKQRREIARQEAVLAELAKERNYLEEEMRAVDVAYSREKERELLSAVRSGDRRTARGVLNKMLAGIILAEPDRLDIVKARLLELAVFVSRAAVEAGADLERLLGLNYQSVERLSHLDTIEELCFWIVRMLDQFMDSVSEANNTGKAVVREAIRYIQDNIDRKLTVKDIAEAVHVSTSHLSHLIKQELGMSVMECATATRLEEATRFLGDLQYNISEVAEMVGYQDPAHFSRAFKKNIGLSPSAFRERAARYRLPESSSDVQDRP